MQVTTPLPLSLRSRAFTLIELMVTVAVIAILTGIAAVSYSGIQARGRDAQRVNDINQIKIALSTYFNAQQPYKYPAAASTVTIDSSTDALTAALEPNFIKDVPVDPLNSGSNVYKYTSTTPASVGGVTIYKGFTLTATFENTNNKKGWGGGTGWVVDGYIVQED